MTTAGGGPLPPEPGAAPLPPPQSPTVYPAPAGLAAPQPSPGRELDPVSVWALPLAVLLPLIGLVLGIVGLTRTGRTKRRGRPFALAAVVVAPVAGVVGGLLVAAVLSALPPSGAGVEPFAVGDCTGAVLDPTSADVVAVDDVGTVDCSQPHTFEVFHIEAVPAALDTEEFPGDPALQDAGSTICVDAYTAAAAADSAFDAEAHEVSVLWPAPAAWGAGDRDVTCLLYRVDGTQMTGGPQLGG